MLRQASSRNQRSKGFKVKHALQIGLLVAICIWLLYQVKHSHEKKRALVERNSNILNNVVGKKEDFFKFGRKDLPHIEETPKEEENEETQEEVEAEAEEGHDTKQEEIENEEEKGARDDDIDEQDQDKGDEEESAEEEEKDNNDNNNNEEEKDEHGEVDVFDNQEHEGGTQEAREENYKRDDASSAVVHNDHTTESETGAIEAKIIDEEPVVDKIDYDSDANTSNGINDTGVDGVNTENLEKNDLELGIVTNGTYDGTKNEVVPENLEKNTDKLEHATNGTVVSSVNNVNGSIDNAPSNETIQYNNNFSNATVSENMDREIDNKDEIGSVSNSTIEYISEQPTNSTNQAEVQHISMITDATTSSNTGSIDSAQNQNNSNDNTTLSGGMVQSQKLPDVVDASANNTNVGKDDIKSQDVLDVSANNANTGNDELKSQNVVNPDEDTNTTVSSTNENGDATLGVSDNLSHDGITEEERDARVDISTLPDIQNEIVKTLDDEAAK